tara:strand:- start:1895 stop:2743 length:849 start_codon:yes stop_codon:yes gene_type:complete
VIQYLKNLFFKKENTFSKSKIFVQGTSNDIIKKMNLSDNEKIELLIKRIFWLSDDKISDSSSLEIDFGCDGGDVIDLISGIEYVFNINAQENGFELTIGGIKEYVKKKINEPNYIVPDESLHLWPLNMAEAFYSDFRNGRSMAIKQLIDNNYETLNDEYENSFKEPINFTLQYLEKHFDYKTIEAGAENVTSEDITGEIVTDNILISAFPLMQKYIYRQIFKRQNAISIENNFDEQQAYDEFLFFCKNILCSNYPDKNERDIQIRSYFKIMSNQLIEFIEKE